MIKYFTILFLLIGWSSQAQTFTNGSVYDYDVGDTIQTREVWGSLWWSTPPDFFTKIFISKNISLDGDTIYYKYHRKWYRPQGCFSCSAMFSEDTISLTIVHPSDTFIHPNENDTCINVLDTFGIDGCGNYYSHLGPDPYHPSQTCFEATATTSRYSEGLGLTYYYSTDPGDGFLRTKDLIFYHKVNGSTCGNLLNLKELELISHEVNAYPNPAKDWVSIESNLNLETFTINDISGRQILNGDLVENKLSIDNLPKGLYLLSLFKNDQQVHTLKIMKD